MRGTRLGDGTVAAVLAAAALFGTACGKPDAPPVRDTTLISTRQPEPLVFHVVGTEPFWALEIGATGLRFITPEDTAGAHYPVSTPVSSADTLRWHATTGGHTLDARVWPAACSDGMSDRIWTHRAVVRVDTVTYRGCAGQS
jgi:uncharacterized membrane protein